METTPEMFNLALMHLNSTSRPVKKIKVTSEFAEHLERTCPPIYLYKDMSVFEVVRANFTGIPIIVDDEIDNPYYELEY